jgi:hypothetical protein
MLLFFQPFSLVDVNRNGSSCSTRIPGLQRGLLIVIGLVLLTLLAAALTLQPDPRGVGTHQQMGLPPCSFFELLGTRCPACGMTTAWAHVVRGQCVQAIRVNAGGAMLAALAVLIAPWALVSGMRGHWVVGPLGDRATVAVCFVVVIVTLIDWASRYLLASGS